MRVFTKAPPPPLPSAVPRAPLISGGFLRIEDPGVSPASREQLLLTAMSVHPGHSWLCRVGLRPKLTPAWLGAWQRVAPHLLCRPPDAEGGSQGCLRLWAAQLLVGAELRVGAPDCSQAVPSVGWGRHARGGQLLVSCDVRVPGGQQGAPPASPSPSSWPLGRIRSMPHSGH